MPATEVEFHDGNEAFGRIIICRYWEQSFRVCHEAASMSIIAHGHSMYCHNHMAYRYCNVLCDPL